MRLTCCLAMLFAPTVKTPAAFAQTPAHTMPAPCQPVEVAQLPLKEVHGQFITTLSVNDQNLPFLVDTGSSVTVMTPRAANSLGLAPDLSRSLTVEGYGVPVNVGHPRIVRSIRLGPREWQNYAILTADFLPPVEQADPTSSVGILGADLLSQYDVELDFPSRIMTLYQSSACGVIPWAGPYQRWRSVRTAKRVFVIPVSQ